MNKGNFVLAALSLALTLAGCAHQPNETAREMSSAVQPPNAAAKGSEPPAEVSAALLPPINVNVAGAVSADTEQRFDVRVRNVPARDFFLGLVDGTPYNIVVPNELTGTITLDLKNVTVPEVMETVREHYGFEYDRSERGYAVLPERINTRIYYVNYLDVKRAGQSSMMAAPGEVAMSRGSQGSSATGANQGNNNATYTTQGSYSRINTDSSSDLWAGLADSLRQVLGTGEGRSITVNPQSGVIVARGMPAELRAVGDFLSAMQGMVQRQVVLEARILEVQLSDGFQSGINWGTLRPAAGGSTITAGQFGGGSSFTNANGYSNLQNQTNALYPSPSFDIRGDVAGAFGGVFAMAIDTADFTAFIELLKTQGNVQVLSNPRVSTINNQKAVIKVGGDEFYITRIDSSQTVNTNGTTEPQVQVELTPFFSGVALDVTPQISREGDIVLHVHPSVSQVSELTKSFTVSSKAYALPTAVSTIRESDSVVRARDSQIVVIGGLMQTREQDQDASVPWISDIPLIGNLFKHKKKQKVKSELVILLKPMIVKSDESWGEQMHQSSPTIRKLGGAQ